MKTALLFLLFALFITTSSGQNTPNYSKSYGLAFVSQIDQTAILGNAESDIFNSEILKKRLETLNKKTPLDVVYNATIERFIRLYLKTRKESLANLIDKARYYFPIFEESLDKYDLPLEIKYLAIVESALDPRAKSVAGATGIWQIMYHTGKQYNLNVDSYVDERSDVLKATQAACEYLSYLYNRFENWDLALAAYNSGPGNVSKAIRRSGGMRNYWNIRKYLPNETSSYIPAFYATYYLLEYSNEHGISPKNSQIIYDQTDTIQVSRKLTFKEIKKRTYIDSDLLAMLNPQYKLNIIPGSSDHNYTLTLPKNLISTFIETSNKKHFRTEDSVEKATYIVPSQSNSHVIKTGENLQRIAKKFNISVSQLKTWNGLETNFVIEGQRLVISDTPIKNTEKIAVVERISNTKDPKTYIVKDGDSLWKISRQFKNVTINDLRNWNQIWGASHVKPGTVLKILTD